MSPQFRVYVSLKKISYLRDLETDYQYSCNTLKIFVGEISGGLTLWIQQGDCVIYCSKPLFNKGDLSRYGQIVHIIVIPQNKQNLLQTKFAYLRVLTNC